MKTILRMLCTAAVAGMVLNAVPAEAGIWGWLERLSGPGPFDQRFAHIGVRALCPPRLFVRTPPAKEKDDTSGLFRPSSASGATCFYVDRAGFVSRNDAFVGGTSDITATVWGFGVTTLMVRWLEVGAGMGVASFNVSATDVTATRLTLTPGRLVLRPARLVCPDGCGIKDPKWRGALDVFKVYFKTDVMLGTLQSKDFGVTGNFREKYDAVSSWGLLLDLSEVFSR